VREFLSQHLSEILGLLAALVAGGVGGSLITLRITRQNRVSGSGSVADQAGASAGGDIVGRDKTVSGERRR
jgi:hypothetical protein